MNPLHHVDPDTGCWTSLGTHQDAKVAPLERFQHAGALERTPIDPARRRACLDALAARHLAGVPGRPDGDTLGGWLLHGAPGADERWVLRQFLEGIWLREMGRLLSVCGLSAWDIARAMRDCQVGSVQKILWINQFRAPDGTGERSCPPAPAMPRRG